MKRLAAIVALLVGAATLVFGVVVAVREFPRGVGLLACVVIAAAAAWYGVLRRGIPRVAGLTVAGLAVAGALVLIIVGGRFGVDFLVLAGLLVTLAATRASFAARVDLPRVAAPLHAVLFYNPLSGGGKAERFALAKEARARGIEPIELKRGDDLEVLVRGAVERGADGLAMAGGDGSQAIVAAIAAEYSLPYACIPAGTAITSRWTSGSTVTMSSARSTRSSTAASGGWTWPRSTAACSSTTCRSACTPRRSSAPSTAAPRSEPCSTPCPTRSVPVAASSICAGPGQAGTNTKAVPRCSSPTTATASAVRSVPAPVRGSTTACSASP